MAQFLRPSSDVSTGAWTSTPLWSKLDDNSDSDFVTSNASGTDQFECHTNNPTDPQSSSGHILRIRVKRDLGNPNFAGVQVRLVQGTTVKATLTEAVVGTTYSTKTYTLSASEADSITDYNDLRIRVTEHATSGAALVVAWVELEIPDLAVPAQVTGVNATDGTYTDKVRVSWNSAARADDYNIYRNTSNSWTGATKIKDGDTASPYDDTTATPGTTYYYGVRGSNAAGEGPNSALNSGYALGVPSTPTGVAASDGTFTDKVRITWNAASGADTYKVYRNTIDSIPGTPLATGISTTSYDDTSAGNEITYYYWVKATNVVGDSGASTSDTGYRVDFPAVPANLAATDGAHSTKVALTWDAATGADTYKVFRNTVDSIPGSPLATGVATNSYDDTTAVLDTTYYYWVKSTNEAGDSAASASDSGYASASGVTATVSACIADAAISVGSVVVPQPNRTWRDLFVAFNPSSQLFHAGLVDMNHSPTVGSGDSSSVEAHHFTLGLRDRSLHHFVYADTFPSAFLTSLAFTTSERGGSYLDRPDSILVGFWSWGSHPDHDRKPLSLLYEASLPWSDDTVPNTAGYPSYAAGNAAEDCWAVLPATDFGLPGVHKVLRRVGLELIPPPSLSTTSSVEVSVIPHPVNAQGFGAERVTAPARSVAGYNASGVTPEQPTRYVYVDFDPSTNPGVSGSASGEGFEVRIKLGAAIGIRRAFVEVDLAGETDMVDSQL